MLVQLSQFNGVVSLVSIYNTIIVFSFQVLMVISGSENCENDYLKFNYGADCQNFMVFLQIATVTKMVTDRINSRSRFIQPDSQELGKLLIKIFNSMPIFLG